MFLGITEAIELTIVVLFARRRNGKLFDEELIFVYGIGSFDKTIFLIEI